MTTRIRARRPVALAAVLALAVLPACGGGGGGGGNTPTTLPPAPVRSLLIQGNFSFVSVSEAQRQGVVADYGTQEFNTSGAGTLEVNVDWTFNNSQMGVVIIRGSCSFAQIDAALEGTGPGCPEAGGGLVSSRPHRLVINNLPAGLYTLLIINASNNNESGNFQVFLTR